ncbi:hypothetical protein SAMN04489712_106313 [Thermomonospora echinospora]|uniref:Uncharacterized protein n=1 Tax=Thermomonospora echinospora TaxID=1992 RepID=A0A1H6B7R8_9ACTN|nr:hypothetical protein [Thermomonospora echinospora]SEG56445.1 hypothetical protein SAMN04489712_106313 [Thermomonospora echinospora]
MPELPGEGIVPEADRACGFLDYWAERRPDAPLDDLAGTRRIHR